MKNPKFKTALLGVLTLLTLGLFTTGCSSDDNSSEPFKQEKDTYKITVTLADVDQDRDYVSITFVGGTITGKTDVWKVNGVVKTNEAAASLSKKDFGAGAKTYVIETTEPIHALTGSVQIINYGADLPFNYTIEKAGKVLISEKATLSGDGKDFTKQYTF